MFVAPDFTKYVRAAAATRAIFARFDPEFEAGSLDEAYLDISEHCRQHELTGEGVCCPSQRWPAGLTGTTVTILHVPDMLRGDRHLADNPLCSLIFSGTDMIWH